MRLTRDEPGRLLVLEEDVGRLPAATLPILLAIPAGVMALIGGPGAVRRILALLAAPDARVADWAMALAPIVLFAVGPLLAIGITLAGAAGPYRHFSVDARAGAIRTIQRNILTGRDRTTTIPLGDLLGVRVETLQGVGRASRSPYRTVASGTSRPNLRITFRQARMQRVVDLPVDELDKPAETADFAVRLGAAAGLPWQRVVWSDAREAEVELSREGGADFVAVSAAPAPADYARDVVAPAAAAAVAEERIPPFDPKAFDSTYQATTWRPGELVRFDKPLGAPAIGCLPFVLAGFLVGPAVFLAPSKATPPERLASVVVLGLVGVLFGLVALVPVQSALPGKVVLDWGARLVTAGGLLRRSTVAFADVSALELRCIYTRHRGKNPWDGFKCDLVALVRDPITAQLVDRPLVSTRERRDDPDTPYRQALPLAADLAKALGVERRVVPYPR